MYYGQNMVHGTVYMVYDWKTIYVLTYLLKSKGGNVNPTMMGIQTRTNKDADSKKCHGVGPTELGV